MFIVNKLIIIYFTWFVYTFVNYKYNVLLKRDDVLLMPLSTFVTLSRFNDGKEKSVIKWPSNPVLNVLATSWQHRTATLSQRRKQPSFSTVSQRCDNVNNDVVTTL